MAPAPEVTSQGSSPVLRWANQEIARPLPGIIAAVRIGARLSAAMFTLEPGAVVPTHTHDNEEFGQVVRGSLELQWSGETTIIHAGEAFLLPAGVSHGARAGHEGCDLLECYAPPRNPVPPTLSGDAP